MKTTALHPKKAGSGRSSVIRGQSPPGKRTSKIKKPVITTSSIDDAEGKTVAFTIIHSGIVWYDWG